MLAIDKYIKVPNSYIKAAAMLIIVFCLNACAGKTVYLFNTGYSQDAINQVSEQLILLGYKVEPVDAEIPAEFADTAIATHPVFSAPNDLAVIQDILTKAEFPSPTYYQFAQGNHFYSPKSIGLYLRNGYQKNMPPVMADSRCTQDGKAIDAVFEFYQTGGVKLEIEVYENGEYVLGSNQKFGGTYTLLNSTLNKTVLGTIKLDFTQFSTDYLSIEQVKVQTYAGEKNADHLVFHSKQKNTLIEGCLFEAIYD
jgi:hypothetical protein